MRILAVSAQLPGHLDWGGYLDTAVELTRRGHQVLWASGSAVRTQVERAGLPFHQLTETGWRWPPPPPLAMSPAMDTDAQQRLRAERALDQWLDVARVAQAVTELLTASQAFQPDLILGENFMSAAAIVAELLGVPFVVVGWPAFQAEISAATVVISEMAHDRLNALLQNFGATGSNWTTSGPPALLSPHLHITYWSPRWYSGLAFLPQTMHVGGRTKAPPALAANDPSARLLNHEAIADLPWVLITLGTSFQLDPNFFIAASHAAERVGALPLVVLGGEWPHAELQRLRTGLARSAVVLARVEFDAVLPAVGAAIHHGGAGTTHALARHGVPQIVVPHAADQMHQAHGVARSQVGVGIRPQHVTIEALMQLLTEMLTEDSTYQQNAQLLQTEMAALGGVSKAADLLETLVHLDRILARQLCSRPLSLSKGTAA
ncbi:MAG: glycosyltransferase [Caldilineaceae bacterium]